MEDSSVYVEASKLRRWSNNSRSIWKVGCCVSIAFPRDIEQKWSTCLYSIIDAYLPSELCNFITASLWQIFKYEARAVPVFQGDIEIEFTNMVEGGSYGITHQSCVYLNETYNWTVDSYNGNFVYLRKS